MIVSILRERIISFMTISVNFKRESDVVRYGLKGSMLNFTTKEESELTRHYLIAFKKSRQFQSNVLQLALAEVVDS